MKLAGNHNETVLSGASARPDKPPAPQGRRQRLASNHNETILSATSAQ